MIRKRLLDAMQQSGAELMLVCSHENVAYCSGVGLPLPFGAVFDYGGGYPLGYVLADCAQKKTTLVISDQYRATVRPMFSQYIANYVEFADIIVAGGGKNARIVDILAGYVSDELSKRAYEA